MPLKITARTILQLGAELISSDAVAVYELVKNAIDARSKRGVDVKFNIVLTASDFDWLVTEAAGAAGKKVSELRQRVLDRLVSSASEDRIEAFKQRIDSTKTVEALVEEVKSAYVELNQIVIRDTGHGMTLKDLEDVYLTVGTVSRAKEIDAALKRGETGVTPYLGEKGVGRLAVMRLGWKLKVETATSEDKFLNVLEVDWRDFERAYDKSFDTVEVKPTRGPRKPADMDSGTIITISDLRAPWTSSDLTAIAMSQISRVTDPFSLAEKRRFQIRLYYNDQIVEHTRSVASDLLNNAHAVCKGEYRIVNGRPELKVSFETKLYDGAPKTETFDFTDLYSLSLLKSRGLPSRYLRSLGPFSFEFYWYNRQRLRAIEGLGDREQVRTLIRQWSGLSLFRDTYRVLPYGDPGDDWLGLDIDALGSSGYKLNTKQLIGRVRIGRLANPHLLDQTNRQGLIDRPEKDVLIALLHDLISEKWRKYLDDAGLAKKVRDSTFDVDEATSKVDNLEDRTRKSIRLIRRDYKGDQEVLQQVQEAFKEIRDAHQRAIERIGTIEIEKDRMSQLAGVGLIVEVIAHELTRATESTQTTLKSVPKGKLDVEVASAFRALEQQLRVIQKRLQILEPLTIPARQRRGQKDLGEILAYVLSSHTQQFERHKIDIHLKGKKSVVAFVIEGHVVQILENLITNSVYWLDVERADREEFKPQITVEVADEPPRLRISDNGPGIPSGRQSEVFEAFFSTKPKVATRRSGLGLYIARQNAELLGGTLELVREGSVHERRFNTFELTLKKDAQSEPA